MIYKSAHTETGMSPLWRNCDQLYKKNAMRQFQMRPVTKISSQWHFLFNTAMDTITLCLDFESQKTLPISWWRHIIETFPCYWPSVLGIHRWPANSSHKGQWRGNLAFSLICAWINGWLNNRETGDLRCQRTHCDVIAMLGGVFSKYYWGDWWCYNGAWLYVACWPIHTHSTLVRFVDKYVRPPGMGIRLVARKAGPWTRTFFCCGLMVADVHIDLDQHWLR